MRPVRRSIRPTPGSARQSTAYLDWLSKDRATSIQHIGYAFLFICGLERRLLLERADLNEIVREIIRLRVVYVTSRVLGLHLNRFLSFAVAHFDFRNFDSQLLMTAFERPPPNCKEDDLAVAVAWFLRRPPLAGIVGHGDRAARSSSRPP